VIAGNFHLRHVEVVVIDDIGFGKGGSIDENRPVFHPDRFAGQSDDPLDKIP
jgi:hypothetical protein